MSEEISIKVSYVITLSDLNDALFTYTRVYRSRLDLIVGAIAIANALLQSYISGLNWLVFASLALGIVILSRGYLLIASILLFRRHREIYNTTSDVTIDREGIHVEAGALDATRVWRGYQIVIETEKTFVFVYAKMGFFVLPKRALASKSQEDELRSIVQAKVPEYRNLVK